MAWKGLRVEGFYRIIRESTMNSKKLVLPSPFVEKYGGLIANDVKIVVADGCCWNVRMSSEGELLYLNGGLNDFMDYYSIDFGHVLVFEYKGNSVFDVNIYDATATEIKYPCNYKSQVDCVLGESIDKQVANKVSKHKGKASCSDGGVAILTQMRQSRREEKCEELNAVTAMESNFLSFTRVIKKYNVEHPFILHMPRSFAEENPCIQACEYLKLEDADGNRWSIKCMKERGKARNFGKEWQSFVKEKGLIAGDVWTFELVEIDDPTFKVTICRATAND